jgi:hypothetical protein
MFRPTRRPSSGSTSASYSQSILYREIIAVCSEIHIKYVNTVCGQNVEFLVLNVVVHTSIV